MLSPEILETYRSLQSAEDPHFLKNFLNAYLDALPGHLGAMKKAVESGDAKKLAHSAHAVKSSSLNLDLASVVDLCTRLQKAGDQEKLEGTLQLFDELESRLKELRAEIYSLPEYG